MRTDIQALMLIGAFLEVMKEEDPSLHEKIAKKYEDIMSDIKPDKTGISINDFIKLVLSKAP